MDTANWLTEIGQAGRLFAQSISDAFWPAYAWAKDWQFFLGGVLVLIAAQIFAQASVRSARIRAAASVRAAEIAAGLASNPSSPRAPPELAASANLTNRSAPQRDQTLSQKLELLRSLIRSAMALAGSDAEGAFATGNIYCERISRLRFEERDLTGALTPGTLELYKRLLLQLAVVRRANEKWTARGELSEALFQLNARARELAAAVAPFMSGPPSELARLPGQVRG